MAKNRKTQEFESYVDQARRNLDHYEQRLKGLLKLKEEEKTDLSRNRKERLSSMIANEEAAVSRYKAILAHVEQKLVLAKADI